MTIHYLYREGQKKRLMLTLIAFEWMKLNMWRYIVFCFIPLITVDCCFPGLTSDEKSEGRSVKLKDDSKPNIKSSRNVPEQKKFGEPKVSLETANSRFQACCKNVELLGDCLKVCRYDIDKTKNFLLFNELKNPPEEKCAIQLTTIFDAFFKKNCSAENIFTYIQCASGGERSRDVTECCQKSQIFEGKGNNCRPFCRQDPPAFQIHRNVTACGFRINKIMDCYWLGMRP
uniref:Domain of unknown function DB domain-containing protein n=1 Tax=Romanomermis culicivorax TaxID=13658 RepID=A0A915HUB5_ROMCU